MIPALALLLKIHVSGGNETGHIWTIFLLFNDRETPHDWALLHKYQTPRLPKPGGQVPERKAGLLIADIAAVQGSGSGVQRGRKGANPVGGVLLSRKQWGWSQKAG